MSVKHTHTHTHIYIYIEREIDKYTYSLAKNQVEQWSLIREVLNKWLKTLLNAMKYTKKYGSTLFE